LLLAVGQTSEDRAWTLADQMVQEARGSPDPSTRAGALLDRLTVLQLRPLDWPAEQRMEAAIAALEAAEEAGRDDLVLLARRQRIPLALELGDATLLDADIQRFASESDRVRIRSQRHHAASYLAMRALQTGRFDDARVWIDAAETLADPSDPREAVFTPLTQRLLLPCTPESDRAIETSLLRCIEVLPLPHWSTALARFYFDTGREEDAAAVVNRLLAEGFPKGLDRNIGWLVAVAAVAHVCAGLDWRAPSAAFFELLEPFSQYNIAIGFGIGCMGPVSYYLGDLAVTAGQYAKATCHLESALAMTERMNARPWEAVVRLARARLFLHRGEPGDARAERDTALKLADGLGLDELRARGDALLS
jgi:tetratricopeptide (TPR) repeat protein